MDETRPEDVEKPESAPGRDVEHAEMTLRNLERQEASREAAVPAETELPAAEPAADDPLDTSDEWWNKKEEKADSQSSLLDRAKKFAAIGAAGTLILGSTLFVGREAMQNSMQGESGSDNQVTQELVVEKPAAEQNQFVINENKTVSLPAAEASASAAVSDQAKTATPAAEQVEAQPAATESAQVTWAHDVPVQSQQSLTFKGKDTAYGCVPTSTSMVSEYWHQKNPDNPALSAQQLIDTNAEQGEFSSTGMSASNVHDELDSAGYRAEDHMNSDQQSLKTAVAEGPVIAVVKLNMSTTGANHAVVVTGISDKNEVRVNDPWTGKASTYSWETFSKSWGAGFGTDVPRNNFVSITPKK